MGDHLNYRRGVLLIVAAGVVWSLNGLLLRWVGEAGTWQVLFYRSIGMVPALYLWLNHTTGGRARRAMAEAGWPGIVGGFGLVCAFAGAIYSMQSTTIANAVFLFAAAPLISAVMARPILGEAVRPITWVAIAVASAGIYVMVREGLSLGEGWGNMAALGSAAGFSAFTLTLRRAHLSDMMPAVVVGACLSIVVSGAVIALRGESYLLPAHATLIAMAMGAVTIVGGMILFTIGARAVPAAEAGLLALVEVMLAPVWVWLVLQEETTVSTLTGGAILLGAIILNTLSGLSRGSLAAPEKPRTGV